MDQGLIPSRYAKALYKTALERGVDRRLYSLCGTLVQAFASNAGLAGTVANPFVDAARKQELLLAAAGVEKSAEAPLYADFLKLLVQNNRLPFIRDIAIAYRELYRKANNIHRVKVTSAVAMDPAVEERLKKVVADHLGPGSSMEYASAVDPALIGGFTVAVDNERLDASVANELAELRRSLIKN